MSVFNLASTADLKAEVARAQKAEQALAAQLATQAGQIAALRTRVANLEAAGTPVSTPVPAPTPTPVPTPTPNPSQTVHPGNYTAKAGEVVENLDIQGAFSCTGSGVTMRNCTVRGIGENNWIMSVSDHFTGEDISIGGGADGKTFNAAIGLWSGGPGNVFTNLEIHHTSDAARIDGGTTLINPNFHDLIMGDPAAPGAHSDGIQVTAGSDPIVIHGGVIEGGNNDALFCQTFKGPLTVDGTRFVCRNRNGEQSSYGVRVVTASTATVTNCVFTRGWQVGAIAMDVGTQSGNTYDDGTPIT